nr:molybdate ABC transporter substrate-binding protein [Tissierella sp.]
MKRNKFLVVLLAAVLSLTVLIGCSPKEASPEKISTGEESSKEEVELLVAAAASLTDVLEEIKILYKEEAPGVTLNLTLGSSGALQTQIEEGAPVDVFMSAANKQMDALETSDNILEGTRKTLLINKVVLIAPKESLLELKSFDDLSRDDVKKIGVGDPTNVPVGQYSEEIFNNLKIKNSIEEKLVLGSDVRTVLTWVETGEVDLGLVYKTDAISSDKVTIISEAPKGSHKEVTYPVAVVKDSKQADAARDFLDFLSNKESMELFKKYGFAIK